MKLILLFATLAFSGLVHAGIGPAGCGLGNVVFNDQNQILAATTNGTSGNQTFGITSGTSNCVNNERSARLESFVEANQVALNKEAARGEGATLASLNEVLGCQKDFAPVIKDHYKQIFTSNNAKEISTRISVVVDNNNSQCGS